MKTYAMFNYEQIDWISGFYEGLKGPSAYVSHLYVHFEFKCKK